MLARLHRAGELQAVWTPDEAHEAMRDLIRARKQAVEALKVARQQLQSFLLRTGCGFPAAVAGARRIGAGWTGCAGFPSPISS